MLLPTRRNVLYGIALPAVGYILIHYAVFERRQLSPFERLGIDPATIDLDTISPKLAQQLGLRSKLPATELVVVLISAGFCSANSVAGFNEAVGAIRELLQTQVNDQPTVVTRMIGISLDTDARTGSEYLLGLAQFDEIIAGGNWLNTATEKFLWTDTPEDVNIPQIVILQRSIRWSGAFPDLGTELVLKRIVGPGEIIEWVSRGAPAQLTVMQAESSRLRMSRMSPPQAELWF